MPGALVNFAALLMGKVPVNLNYTVSEETLASCIRQCGIKTVLTSRTFLDKVKLKVPAETILIEELLGRTATSGRQLGGSECAGFDSRRTDRNPRARLRASAQRG